jgi:hypothetical protein
MRSSSSSEDLQEECTGIALTPCAVTAAGGVRRDCTPCALHAMRYYAYVFIGQCVLAIY